MAFSLQHRKSKSLSDQLRKIIEHGPLTRYRISKDSGVDASQLLRFVHGRGKRRILFVAPDGKRRAIRLGKVSQRNAEQVKFRIERLLEAKLTGHAIDADTARWIAELEEQLADKLARVDLIPKPEPQAVAKLGPFLRAYLDGRADLKPATKIVRGQVIRDLTNHFGELRDVQTITPGDADDFKQWLVGRKLAPTTIHKRLQSARSFFDAMRRRKLIDDNPFEGVKAAATGIKDRQRFVTRQEIARVWMPARIIIGGRS